MEITKTLIYPVADGSALLAVADVILDDAFIIRGFKISVHGKTGLWDLQMPRKQHNGEWTNICNPMNNDMRQYFMDCIFDAYEQHLAAEGATA